jgi:hypothetical protein
VFSLSGLLSSSNRFPGVLSALCGRAKGEQHQNDRNYDQDDVDPGMGFV